MGLIIVLFTLNLQYKTFSGHSVKNYISVFVHLQ